MDTLEQTSEEIFCITASPIHQCSHLSTQIAIDKIAGKAKKTFEECGTVNLSATIKKYSLRKNHNDSLNTNRGITP